MRVRFSFEGAETEVVVPDSGLAPRVAALFPGSRIEEVASSALDGPLAEVADPASDGPLESVVEAEPTVMRVTLGPEGYDFSTREGRSTFDSVPDLLAAVEFAVVTDLLAQDDLSTHLSCRGRGHLERCRIGVRALRGRQVQFGVGVVYGGASATGRRCGPARREWPLGAVSEASQGAPRASDRQGIALKDTPAWEPGSEEEWFDPTTAGGWAPAGCRAALLARIEYGAEDEVRVREEEAEVGLRLLLDAVQTRGLRREQSMDRLIALLEGVRVCPHEAARVLAEIAEEAGPSGTPGRENGFRP